MVISTCAADPEQRIRVNPCCLELSCSSRTATLAIGTTLNRSSEHLIGWLIADGWEPIDGGFASAAPATPIAVAPPPVVVATTNVTVNLYQLQSSLPSVAVTIEQRFLLGTIYRSIVSRGPRIIVTARQLPRFCSRMIPVVPLPILCCSRQRCRRLHAIGIFRGPLTKQSSPQVKSPA
jgi:hypothetical protein